MYYIVSKICLGGHFLENCFYCYSQQIISTVANEPLIPYNLTKRAPYFICVENCYLLTWSLVHILSNLKTFKEVIKTFWMWRDIFYWNHHIAAFSAGNLPFPCFCWIVNFSCNFSLLFGFLPVSMSFYKNTFVCTFIVKNVFFYPPLTDLQYKVIHSCNYS